jgi:hypothetical protein
MVCGDRHRGLRPYALQATTPFRTRSITMTLCPIAIAVGCKKCPAFAVCPLKSVIGDEPPKKDGEKPAATPTKKR